MGLYVLICFFAKLYADAFINLYYFIISLFGWYYWMYGRKFQSKNLSTTEQKAVIIRSSYKENIFLIIFTVLLYAALGFLLQNFTDSNVPWADAFNTSIFIIAMYLMAKKNIYHWIFWIAGDLASIPLYIYKNLNVTAFQYFIFLIIAVAGHVEWRKKLNAQITDGSN